jgi:hypothetical protein
VLNWGQPIGEDWNVSSLKTIEVPKKKDNWNVFGVVCLRTLKGY